MLSAELLLVAYTQGIFPMADDGEIHWFSPDPRGVLPLGPRRWNHGLRAALRSRDWRLTTNCCFLEVMRGCAARRETWINEIIVQAYGDLHRRGSAHSVEVWLGEDLVGGLYGVHLGAAFFGESMFSRVSGASKVALIWLIESLTAADFQLLDTQWLTPHLRQFGGVEIRRATYLRRLNQALKIARKFPQIPLAEDGGRGIAQTS